ncbi:MAG: hypothetical protein HY721_29730 [Planctomycetes bacterium]|nr:hypothetical protein [Planctomycetota bacterium]
MGTTTTRAAGLCSCLVLAAGLRAAPQALEARAATAGTAAIFREPGFPGAGAPSSPDVLERALAGAGFATRFAGAADLADPAVLAPGAFDLVVLPYGRSFPAAARDNFVAYLRGGGGFISMGGYAFLDLLVKEGGRWVREDEELERRVADALERGSLLADGGFEADATRDAPLEGDGGGDAGTDAGKDGSEEHRGDAGGTGGGARWRRTSPGCRVVEDAPAEGARCALASSDDAGGGCAWHLSLPAAPGRLYRVTCRWRTDGLRGPGFAYAAVYQHASGGALVTFRDFVQARGTNPWTRASFDFTPAPGAARIVLKCGLYLAAGTAWFDDFRLADVTGLRRGPMNTSSGRPEDGLEVAPERIGAFDADYKLRRVARIEAASGQTLFPAGFAVLGPAAGWAASGVRGHDATRWIPLLEARDRHGRPRGSVGSLLLHHAGHYAGSRWAFFGVESLDLFDPGRPEALDGLGRLARFLARGVYLRGLGSAFPAYESGEEAALSVVVENRGRAEVEAEVEIALDGVEAEGRRLHPVRVAPGGSARVEDRVAVPRAASGLIQFRAVLRLGGVEVDRMESGLVALRRPGASGGAPLAFRRNYLAFGDRSLFLFGSDAYANVYTAACEGPLGWARELDAARDHGFQIYENLGYVNPGHAMGDLDWRRLRGMAQLCEERGLVFMPGILIGHNVAVSDERIAEESRLCGEYAERLKDVPKLLWYLNGDYQLRHDDPVMLREKWRAFLEARRGRPGAPELDVPFPPPPSAAWDSAPQADLARFHLQLMTDWNAAHAAAIRARDPAHPITSEYYSIPFSGIDLRRTIDGLDLSNIGYFDEPEVDIDRLPLRIRWNDLRAQGKSVGLGEYGVKTHPAWTRENGASGYHIRRSEEDARRLFLAVAHYAFGMGCSRVQSWCLRDSDERVFPWGAFHPGPLVPKDVAWVHRNLSLCFRLFEPAYEPPSLTVVLCDALRAGARAELGLEGGQRAFEALLGLHADFNVLGDTALAEMPRETRAAVYPAGLAASDESFEALVAWVRGGGRLLVTGGPAWDAERRPAGAARLRGLAGVEWVERRYSPPERAEQAARPLRSAAPSRAPRLPPLSAAPLALLRPAGAEVLATAEDGSPVLVRHAVGAGRVWLFADPLELAPAGEGDDLRRLYGWFLEEAGVPRLEVEPDDPRVHVFSQRTRSGRVHIAFNARKGDASVDVRIPTRAGEVSLRVADRGPALAAVSGDGAVTAPAASGEAKVDGRAVISSGELACGGLAAVASLDGLDVRRSAALLCLPFSEGKVAVSSMRAWRRPAVLLGDLHQGAFRVLERVEGAARARGEGAERTMELELDLDADRATLIALLCEEEESARWSERLGLLAASPESAPGR